MTLALDFWSAPGIDMPDIDTFDGMVTFLEDTGEEYQCKWDDDGNYIGEPTKPVGMTVEEHDRREGELHTMSACPVCGEPVVGYEVCSHCGGCSCPTCEEPHQLVRPGKTQPNCECDDD